MDGVLLDSKKNMEMSWTKVQEKTNNKNIHFSEYFKHIGKPFFDILKNIGVKNNYDRIEKIYKSESIKNIKKIKQYPDVSIILKELKKRKFILNILTSKDFTRTKKFLGPSIKYFTFIECGNKSVKGKPYPDQINSILAKLNVKKSDCVYIGDMKTDYLTAKNSGIDFIYAEWGYGKRYNYKYKCRSMKDLLNNLKIIS